jgi:hypothetical protein
MIKIKFAERTEFILAPVYPLKPLLYLKLKALSLALPKAHAFFFFACCNL